MSYPERGYGNYGPVPWHQGSWDIRAAGNFIGGGMGGGLVVFASMSGATGGARAALFLAGIALVGFGLFCVSLELGRPLRALNVFRNPRTSWMAREAWTSVALAPAALAAAAGVAGAAPVAALLALAFVWCQANLLQAAKGIPAWREPLLRPVLLATDLVEGAGLLLMATLGPVIVAAPLAMVAGALLVVRWWLWRAYRLRLAGRVAPRALAALDVAGRVLLVAGTIVPLALIGVAGVAGAAAAPVAALAGLGMAAAGVYAKLVLVTRAGFNQGFALPRLPVRGTRA